MAVANINNDDQLFEKLAAEFFKDDELFRRGSLKFTSYRSQQYFNLLLAVKHELGAVAKYSLDESALTVSRVETLDLMLLALKEMRQQLLELLTDPSRL